jgi:hypothetical protein
MVRLAREQEAQAPLGIDYQVSYARQVAYNEEFDLVVAGYLLNYASTPVPGTRDRLSIIKRSQNLCECGPMQPSRLTRTPRRVDQPAKTADGPGSLLVLGGLALVVVGASGLVGALFRLSLERADRLRHGFVTWAHGHSVAGFLLVSVSCAAATGVAAWLVRRFSPHASGSGIPHVEAVLNEALPPAPSRLVPIKFLGGVLSIGSGLALGREGPTVQMGASLGHLIGTLFGRGWPDNRVLLAAGAGAGLATAFNAPIAGDAGLEPPHQLLKHEYSGNAATWKSGASPRNRRATAMAVAEALSAAMAPR